MTTRTAVATLALTLAPVAAITAASPTQLPPNRVVPLQITGPPTERLNLLVFGDGYTAAEMPKFRADVDKLLNVQWSIEPFKSYRSYFNVYMIEIESPVSGISCDPDDGNVRRDTPLRLQYGGTCPAGANARGVTFGTGGREMLNRIAAQIPGVVPDNRQTLTVGNTRTYGGIGGTDATTTGGAPQGPLVSVHELGHSLGGLQDEYPHAGRGVAGAAYTGEDPTSLHHTVYTIEQMKAGQLKWWRWLGEESHSGGVIGRYESGQSRTKGVWRPSEHSMMRWIGNYFDQPSHERMIQRISGRRGTAAMSVVARAPGEVGANEVLWVETGHPSSHELDVTWTVNGTVTPNPHNSRHLALAPLALAPGDVVRATVADLTDHVRDPEIRTGPTMTQRREWTVGRTATPVAAVTAAFTSSTPTDRVEHRAIDAPGNIGPASMFKATVLPGARAVCSTTLTGAQAGIVVSEGVTCLNGASVTGDVVVRSGGSIVVDGGQISGRLDASGARDVQVFGATILGATSVTGSTGTTTLVNSQLRGGVTLSRNAATSFGMALVANTIASGLTCTGGLVSDFGAPNTVDGPNVSCALTSGQSVR